MENSHSGHIYSFNVQNDSLFIIGLEFTLGLTSKPGF